MDSRRLVHAHAQGCATGFWGIVWTAGAVKVPSTLDDAIEFLGDSVDSRR